MSLRTRSGEHARKWIHLRGGVRPKEQWSNKRSRFRVGLPGCDG